MAECRYSFKHSPWYPLDKRLGGPQSLSGHGGKEEKISAPARNQTRHPASSLVNVLTELTQFLHTWVTAYINIISFAETKDFLYWYGVLWCRKVYCHWKKIKLLIKMYETLTRSISSSGSFWLRNSEMSLSRKCKNHPRVSRSKMATSAGRARLMMSRLNNRKSNSTPCSFY
jgi:hypothetical protein